MVRTGGDCYEAAGSLFMDLCFRGGDPDFSRAELVHGVPTLQCEPFIKYGHAWLEFDNPKLGVRMVRDPSNGRDVTMPRDYYYQLGKIDPAECRRYKFGDLRRWVTETGHWGPWEEGDEGA